MSRLFGWLKRTLTRTATQAVQAIDPWDGSGGTYVGEFRRYFDEIITALSVGRTVRHRFNQDLCCAEFYHLDQVVARVKVHGEVCCPYEAIVSTSLPEADRQFFRVLPVRVEFEELAIA